MRKKLFKRLLQNLKLNSRSPLENQKKFKKLWIAKKQKNNI